VIVPRIGLRLLLGLLLLWLGMGTGRPSPLGLCLLPRRLLLCFASLRTGAFGGAGCLLALRGLLTSHLARPRGFVSLPRLVLTCFALARLLIARLEIVSSCRFALSLDVRLSCRIALPLCVLRVLDALAILIRALAIEAGPLARFCVLTLPFRLQLSGSLTRG
jgi:hypothetical protein